jgi:hypothetical protein
MVKTRGSDFPGTTGKVVKFVDTGAEEGMLYIHVRFTDETELAFTITSRLEIMEADLQDWKTGNGVIKRTYIESEEIKQIRAQQPEFERICRQIEREKKQ